MKVVVAKNNLDSTTFKKLLRYNLYAIKPLLA